MKGAPEQNLSNAIALAVGGLPDVRLWRNNTGTIRDSRNIPVSFGLAVGSADRVGIVLPHGRFLSIEVKRPGYRPPSDETLYKARSHVACKCGACHYNSQLDWCDTIRRFGGVAGIVDSVEQALALVDEARKPFSGVTT